MEYESFKYFGDGGKKGDRSVGGWLTRGFTRFQDGDDGGMFPDVWYGVVEPGVVEDVCYGL